MDRVQTAISNLLDGNDLVLIDVGAAHGLPRHLRALSHLATVCFFEPDEKAALLVEEEFRRSGITRSRVFPIALAGSDGPRTLYITRTPTGTSLLKPGSAVGLDFTPSEYFFPMREVTIQTRRLAGVLDEAGLPRADALKLDTQGTELEILQGLGARLSDSALAVEMEIGFPGAYIDQPGFGDLDRLMTQAGFALFDLRLSSFDRYRDGDWDYYRRAVFSVSDRSPSLTKRITEADAIYFRRKDLVVAKGDPAQMRRLCVMLCVYGFFIDALELLEDAGKAGIISPDQVKACHGAVRDWHRASRDVIFDSRWFGHLATFVRRASRLLQMRLLKHRFYRWGE